MHIEPFQFITDKLGLFISERDLFTSAGVCDAFQRVAYGEILGILFFDVAHVGNKYMTLSSGQAKF